MSINEGKERSEQKTKDENDGRNNDDINFLTADQARSLLYSLTWNDTINIKESFENHIYEDNEVNINDSDNISEIIQNSSTIVDELKEKGVEMEISQELFSQWNQMLIENISKSESNRG
jgi:hypothetical protein